MRKWIGWWKSLIVSVSFKEDPLSPISHGKPSSTTRSYHDHFIKESDVSLSSIEEASEGIQKIYISPLFFGKGFDLMKKMGYTSDDPLGKDKGIVEPLAMQFRSNK